MGAEDFFKIKKKNYTRALENILDKKDFPLETKNLMLSMLYKLETNYDDYEKVKKTVTNKNEFIEKIINTIAGLEDIELEVKEQNESGLLKNLGALKTGFFVDEDYIYEKALTYVLNIGRAINIQEVIRNFTGWSWDNKNNEMTYEYENLIYQSFLMIVKEKFMEYWNTDITENHIKNLNKSLTKLYGDELKEEIFKQIVTAALQIAIKDNKVIKEDFFGKYNKLKEKIDKVSNRDELINELNRERKKLFAELKEVETILNNSELLDKEYEKVKDTVLKKEHFEQKLVIKKIRITETMKRHANMLDPKKYAEEKSELEKQLYPIQNAKVEDITKKDIEETLTKLQSVTLKAMLVDISKIDNINGVIKYLYILRYYVQIPFKEKRILDNEEISKQLDYVQKIMINAIYQTKLILAFSTDRETNYKIVSCLFECGVIDIEKVEFLIKKSEDNVLVEIYDGNNKDSEYKLQIDKEKINTIEFNKKKKLFI